MIKHQAANSEVTGSKPAGETFSFSCIITISVQNHTFLALISYKSSKKGQTVPFKFVDTNIEKKLSAWLGFEPGTPGMQNTHSATTPAGLHKLFFEN